jgi:acyl carrier protein
MIDREHIRQIMAAYLGLPIEKLTDSANLFVDLNLDSFKLIILHMALEHECGVELEPDDSVATVAQMIDAMLVAMNQATKRATTLKIVPKASDV